MENQATGKTKPCNVKDDAHELPVKLWNVDTKFARVWKCINHPVNLSIIPLNTNLNNITVMGLTFTFHATGPANLQTTINLF